MSQETFETTLQKIAQLAADTPRGAAAPEAREGAAAFVEGVRDALAGGGAAWQMPIVEVGGGGAVVLLWQDNQRMLSVVAAAQGGIRWFYDPGAPLGYLNLVDASDLLTQGAASPAEFAQSVWPAWARGDAPAAT